MRDLGGYTTLYVEYHGPILDEDGNPMEGMPDVHMMIGLGASTLKGESTPLEAIFQLDSLQDVRTEDGHCPKCDPRSRVIPHAANIPVRDAEGPCKGCGEPIQPGQLFITQTGRHIGC